MNPIVRPVHHPLKIAVESGIISGDLNIPAEPRGLVIFSHGSGSSRHSSRNQYVARELYSHSFATLLFDLLTPEEDIEYSNRFDITLLTQRLIEVTNKVEEYNGLNDLPMGYFGASTGAASAIWAASRLPKIIKAVVSRGGRPDLAMNAIPKLKAPTLLIVGSLDHPVIEMNESAYKAMVCEKKLEIIDGATHLFEERGTLTKVAEAASEWFLKYLK